MIATVKWIPLSFAVIALLGYAAWQQRSIHALRRELAHQAALERELIAARAENERLHRGRVLPAVLQNLRSDHDALARLRAEIEALRQKEDTRP